MRKRTVAVVIIVIITSVFAVIGFRMYLLNKDVKTMTYDGLERTYRLYVPSTLDESSPVPLVIALHGGGATGRNMIQLTQGGLNDLADRENFVVAYPDAIHYNWNDGRNVSVYISHAENVDDVGFISALIDRLASQINIDLSRVYITGMSNGAIMTHRLACELSERIAAIAPVDGSLAKNFVNKCLPTKPVPLMMINGEDDPLLPWDGGAVRGGDPTYGEVIPVEGSIMFWVKLDGCSENPQTMWLPDNDPNDGTRAYRKVYSGGINGTEVILVGIQGGGHTWPGGLQYLTEDKIGKTCRDFDANEMIWSFFKNHTNLAALQANSAVQLSLEKKGYALAINNLSLGTYNSLMTVRIADHYRTR